MKIITFLVNLWVIWKSISFVVGPGLEEEIESHYTIDSNRILDPLPHKQNSAYQHSI